MELPQPRQKSESLLERRATEFKYLLANAGVYFFLSGVNAGFAISNAYYQQDYSLREGASGRALLSLGFAAVAGWSIRKAYKMYARDSSL